MNMSIKTTLPAQTTMKGLLCSALALGVMSSAAQAGIVASWGSLQPISSNDDIVNPGNVIHAVNFGNENADVNVIAGGNNIAFDPTGVFGGSGFKSDSFFVDDNTDDGGATVSGDTDSEFHRVLDSFRDNSASGYTFTGLEPGSYQLQVFASDDRGNRTTQFQVITDFGGLGETIHADTGSLTVGNDIFRSAYVIADIELTSGTTEFTVYKSIGGGGHPINAAVLTRIPEPTTALLAILGLIGVAFTAQRRW